MKKTIPQCLDILKAAAHHGLRQIEAGDVYRLPLPDTIFSQIVPDHLEDAVIDAMVASDEWIRVYDGFILREEYQQ